MANRKNIPASVKLELWVKSAGRCQFEGCNKILWEDGLTLSKGNYADIGHIIAASKDGARGGDNSEEEQTNFSNLMLFCKNCHKNVDDNPDKFPEALLKRWKANHENRIEQQTEYSGDNYKSTVFMFLVNVPNGMPALDMVVARNAMFPKYPMDSKGLKFEEVRFDKTSPPNEWERFAEKIKRKAEKILEEGADDATIKHLSIFGFAPMPFLMYLGKCIGSTFPCDIYQFHRNVNDTNSSWKWKENEEITSFMGNYEPASNKDNIKNVILKLSLSGKIHNNIDEMPSNVAICEISADKQSVFCISTKASLENFTKIYRNFLTEIKAEYKNLKKIYILPALPISAAIQCGRVLLPATDPEIWVCELYDIEDNSKVFKPVLRIN